MKKLYLYTIRVTTICMLVFSVWTTVYAVEDYTLLTPLPGTTIVPNCTGNNCKTNLETYLPGLFNWAIGIAALMAFIVITIGGVTYMTTDSIGGTSKGREMITNAIWGLLLVIGAYVILYTINPAILSLKLAVPPLTIKPATAGIIGGGGTVSIFDKAQDTAVRTTLQNAQIAINNPNPCPVGQMLGCTSLNGLPQLAITGLINLKNTCNCSVIVTGGTEYHGAAPNPAEAHGIGKPVVDLSPTTSLKLYLARTNPAAANPKGAPNPTKVVIPAIYGTTYTYENSGDNGLATAPHWHVVFK